MRCDQFMGLPMAAQSYLESHKVARETCPCCGQCIPRQLRVIGHYDGMFLDQYPLYQYVLHDGLYADEFLQASPWASGPVHFLGLRVTNNGELVSEFTWTPEEIEENI